MHESPRGAGAKRFSPFRTSAPHAEKSEQIIRPAANSDFRRQLLQKLLPCLWTESATICAMARAWREYRCRDGGAARKASSISLCRGGVYQLELHPRICLEPLLKPIAAASAERRVSISADFDFHNSDYRGISRSVCAGNFPCDANRVKEKSAQRQRRGAESLSFREDSRQ